MALLVPAASALFAGLYVGRPRGAEVSVNSPRFARLRRNVSTRMAETSLVMANGGLRWGSS
jgi:hypothetical protein